MTAHFWPQNLNLHVLKPRNQLSNKKFFFQIWDLERSEIRDFEILSVIGPPFSILKGQIQFSFWNSNLQAILHLDLFSKPEDSKINRLIFAVKGVKHGRFSVEMMRNWSGGIWIYLESFGIEIKLKLRFNREKPPVQPPG